MEKLTIRNRQTGGVLRIVADNNNFGSDFFQEDQSEMLTIAWNKGASQHIVIDGEEIVFPANSIATLMANQTFHFQQASDIVAWQFNRQFYCIIDHDKEVSCSGLLFYGSSGQPVIHLNEIEAGKMDLLFKVFLDEFEDNDNLQEDMLRMLLKRMIITVTRLFKKQINLDKLPSTELDLVRQYNLLVEKHFKEWHQVQDYASELNKSPKTLSNLFAQYNSKSPLKVLHERMILEAKRQLIYTDHSIKEIAYEIGFQEVPPFNRLFKKITADTPSNFRKVMTINIH